MTTNRKPSSRLTPSRPAPSRLTTPRLAVPRGSDSAAHAYGALSTAPPLSSFSRRRFLQGALAAGAMSTIPMWMFADRAEASPLGPDERVLVIFLLAGGNDGLNMVIPATDGRYQDARGDLAIAAEDALPMEGGLFLHPNMSNVASLYAAGEVAVVQGVGDPADDLSHFSSMARWMNGSSAGPQGLAPTGWVGRYLDNANLGQYAGIAIGDGGIPLHMRGDVSEITALPSGGSLLGADTNLPLNAASAVFTQIRDGDTGLGFWGETVAAAFGDAVDAAQTVTPIYADGLDDGYGIVRTMQLAGRLINLDVGTRILTVTLGGFDQHDEQLGTHAGRLLLVDQGIAAFFSTLDPAFADRVTMMTFSEFGRSFTANDSLGTDHGTASTSLVIGAPVRGGIYGEQPSFNPARLDNNGDLQHTVDFRSVYATMIDDWIGGDSVPVLGAQYETISNLFLAPDAIPTNPGDACANPTIVGVLEPGQTGAVIYGTAGDDVIVGTSGQDEIHGRSGNDIICAGPGNDLVIGGGGDDVLFGEGGADLLSGGTGHDVAYGNSGGDRIRGGAGNDRLFGNSGADRIAGHGGDDIIHGNQDNDWLSGGLGKDTLFGGDGTDEVHGGQDDDSLFGGAGTDSLFGGPGQNVVEQ